jgi:hypothetical protein
MANDILSLKKVQKEDIFRYVVGNTNYCPIEQQIDPMIFEVFEESIYNGNTKEFIVQDKDFIFFQKELSKLRANAPNMQSREILSICEELEEIAPKTIKI